MDNQQRRARGFTLVELLVVVGIIGILVAIAVWNYLIGLERSKQKKSMADIRSIAGAWEARGTDAGKYNAAGATFEWPETAISYDELVANISPTYVRVIPKIDGWGNGFEFGMDRSFSESADADVYAIRSAGRDGAFETAYDTDETENFDCDIVYSNGIFVVHPKQ